MKNFVVVGGGSAGWITAIYMKKMLPDFNVTVIQSPELGIIGVGEGSTVPFVKFLHLAGVTGDEFLTHTRGTIKNGISFENWNGDNKKYFHSFGESLNDFSLQPLFPSDCTSFFYKNLVDKNLPFEDYRYQTYLSYRNKVDLTNTGYALHFDAVGLAKLLQSKSETHNINVIEGDVIHVSQDEQGFITKIHLKDNPDSIDVDFVFDCTGFHRLILGKIFNQKWLPYSHHLPLNKAIPFWMEHGNDIKPYTTSTAMPYGWVWEIPLQHRIGAGYVFDSNLISPEQAHQQAEKLYNRKLEIRKVIDFNPGRFENFWVKNCMAVGLSSCFLEPLEATSIALTLGQLGLFRFFYNQFNEPDPVTIKTFNEMIAISFDDIVDFIYLHYLTKRNDSEFWNNFKTNTVMPDRVAEFLELAKAGIVLPNDFPKNNRTAMAYSILSYIEVSHGLGLLNANVLNHTNVSPSPTEYRNIIERAAIEKALFHKDILKPYIDKL